MKLPDKKVEYVHGGDIYENSDKKILDFSANINPLGMPESAKKAITENIESYYAYPDPFCRELKKSLGDFESVKEKCIVCGNGAADLIFRIVFALKPKKALLLAPTFSEYETALESCGCECEYFFLKEKDEFCLDESILKSLHGGIDMVFICNPNNPTGAAVKKELMCKIAEKCSEIGAVLVIDECFMDFLYDEQSYSMKSKLSAYKNMIILKAFTKIFAMAGLRLGYMLCENEKICGAVMMTGQPWSVSTVAAKCGIGALEDKLHILKTKEYIKTQRGFLTEELKKCGIKLYPGQANYILLKTDKDFKRKMKKHGILVRSCANYRGLSEEFFRIAVKTENDNKYIIDAIKKEYK